VAMPHPLEILGLVLAQPRRLLDWATLTYSPSRWAVDPGYVEAWKRRHARALEMPVVGKWMKAWDEA
jgi:hypothetical protein